MFNGVRNIKPLQLNDINRIVNKVAVENSNINIIIPLADSQIIEKTHQVCITRDSCEIKN